MQIEFNVDNINKYYKINGTDTNITYINTDYTYTYYLIIFVLIIK